MAAEHRHFSCRRAIVEDVAHVVVGGALDVAALVELDGALRLAWASADEIVLDLGGLESMDFSGAKLIIEADRRIRRAGGHLSVRRAATDLDWLLDFIDLDRVIDLVDRPPVNARAALQARTRVAAYFRSRAGQIAERADTSTTSRSSPRSAQVSSSCPEIPPADMNPHRGSASAAQNKEPAHG